MATLYGIPNCDTVKKARTWLDNNGVAFEFHDFKKAGLTAKMLDEWLRKVDWEILLNRKGTTWRGLPENTKNAVVDAASAKAVMLESPSIIKRPVLSIDGAVHVGFSEAAYQDIFHS